MSTIELDEHVMHDSEPCACPECQTPTDFIQLNEDQQIHQCLNFMCDYVFLRTDGELKK